MCTNSPTGHHLLLHFKGQGMIQFRSLFGRKERCSRFAGRGRRAAIEKEVVIWSMADLLGGKSHSDTDLRRTMHTNEIITDVVGGLLGAKKAIHPSCHIPLFWDRSTCSRYMGIMDNRPPFTGNVVCYLWHEASSPCVCARMQYFVWQSQRHSLWKVPRFCRHWELRRSALSSNTLRYDKRLWSLYRNMKDAMMSLSTQVGRYLEGKKKAPVRHRL